MTPRFLVLVAVVFAGGACRPAAEPPPAPTVTFPDRPFTGALGPHPIGTREFLWTDSARGEPYTRAADDFRRVVVQVWYPTTADAGADTALYLRRPGEFADSAGGAAAKNVRTNSIQDAPVARPTGAGWPVVLYNHGGGWTRWSATFATEWLASHGYVVFSIEHFGFNQSRKYPDGTPFTPDTLTFPMPTGDLAVDAPASFAYLEDPVFRIWVADARFVLDQTARLTADSGPFQGSLDLGRVGAVGWSFGGALAVELTAVDPRVLAAVDHDGQLFGSVKTRGTTRPVMLFHHGDDDAAAAPEEQRAVLRGLMAEVARNDTLARARSTGDWFSVTLANTSHGDFSDLSLFYPRAAGAADPRQVHATINAYTLAFFDRYLKGTPSPLLETPVDSAGIAFRRWNIP